MFNGIGATGIVLIILVALLLFGPNKLPELGRAFGRTLREFKEGAKDIMDEEPKPRKEIRSEEVHVQQAQKSESSEGSAKLPD
ncbi:twin-arginine translocase TatA/TatE family subunit [Paenibacillus sp. YN15]|uniref:twin-arginine translocase TatA/TatE family subunit n=1 Tax=Paenibacillus sp. YN15 TaxID=1742774 RepID=UPI000DCE18EC|nr:twin-arginine translocase TatA/TatE family subunit [Paenibacillus sp. YN15]RAU93192.1 twin-arginine translocase TatA/TatE family subunit [Paenibacillus sp. YN15]